MERAMTVPRRAACRLGAEDGFVTGLVVRVVLGLLLLALVINDGGQLVSAQVRAESVARAAATAGADTWFRTHQEQLARKDAMAAAVQADPNAAVLYIVVDRKAGTVTVSVEKKAGTLVVKRLGFLKQYVTQEATDSEVRTA
jgi:hypothetical protein